MHARNEALRMLLDCVTESPACGAAMPRIQSEHAEVVQRVVMRVVLAQYFHVGIFRSLLIPRRMQIERANEEQGDVTFVVHQ